MGTVLLPHDILSCHIWDINDIKLPEAIKVSRQARVLSNTGIYHIILRGNGRKNIFLDREDKQRFLDGLQVKQREINFLIYAYCVMDNHAHLAMNTCNNNLSLIMKGIAIRYASYFNWKYSRVGHVFQDRFKSEIIENESYLMSVVRYIHNNPVKARIVDNPFDYEWSSFRKYLKPIHETWFDKKLVLDAFANEPEAAITEFLRFSMESDHSKFLECDDEKTIRTLKEGTIYLREYIRHIAPGMQIDRIKENNQLRNEIIKNLRDKTNLSQRTIARLLGIDKKVVERATKS